MTVQKLLTLDEFFEELDTFFLTPSQLEYCKWYSERNARLEGWFRGEGFALLKRLELGTPRGYIPSNWKSEIPFPPPSRNPPKIDFRASFNGEPIYFQFKALSLSNPKEYHDQSAYSQKSPEKARSGRSLAFYIGGKKGEAEVVKDIRIFHTLQQERRVIEKAYCILFVYPSPKKDVWDKKMDEMKDRVEKDLKIATVIEHNSLSDWYTKGYSSGLFISKLEIIPSPVQVEMGAAAEDEQFS